MSRCFVYNTHKQDCLPVASGDLPRSTLRSKMEKYGIAETDASTPSASGKPGSPG